MGAVFQAKNFFPWRKDIEDLAAKRALLKLNGFVQSRFKKPFLAKPLNAVLYIDKLAETLPHLKFIAVERDLNATIVSIIRAKRAERKTPEQFFYVPPPELEANQYTLEKEQVADQIQAIRKRIDEAEVRWGEQRVRRLSYSDLCQDPRRIVREIVEWVGPSLQERPGSHLTKAWIEKKPAPQSFTD